MAEGRSQECAGVYRLAPSERQPLLTVPWLSGLLYLTPEMNQHPGTAALCPEEMTTQGWDGFPA